eukprot:809695-Rhodomonas_salina.1
MSSFAHDLPTSSLVRRRPHTHSVTKDSWQKHIRIVMDNIPTDFMFRMLGEELSAGIKYKFVHGPCHHDWVGPSSAFTELFGRNLGNANAMRFERGSSVLWVVGKHGSAEGGCN